MADESMKPDFEASKLGTKEYWDQRYQQDLKTFEDCGEEGEIWFGKAAENRIVKFVEKYCSEYTRILDLGCANGSLLRKLYCKKFRYVSGVDYSEAAIKLARECIEKDESLKESSSFPIHIPLEVADLTSPSTLPESLKEEFDVLIDKGTWDAMSLGNADVKKYIQCHFALYNKLVTADHYFIIVSCNFTVEELVKLFTKDGDYCMVEELPNTNTFSFGGKAGKTTSGVVFKRIKYY
ncbi:unnamed protein product [Bursaphelenchus okinawaensis]|uniref:Protein-lysine N-methyltransferase BOKJ2_LOCUS2790 n=1 Tax=Bursaphelenchus okinawaensis TaxID=465554 RepID=A0A811K1H5_9BILA|nr:unnamed protein product [Bursaphelenchus okinawaensis]CAG9089772.1 unnamed protein product [Bursaphelenchus okinawaensis]